MRIEQLAQSLRALAVFVGDNPLIADITYDSRQVKPGTLFVAIQGFVADGHTYIPQALAQGAVAVLSELPPQDETVPWIQVQEIRSAMAEACQYLWGVSFDSIEMVGITGTNGKTTIATLFNDYFVTQYGQSVCWQTGTIGNRLGEKYHEASRTTPEAVDLLRWLGEAATKPKVLVMETSSHALSLERLRGFFYDVAVFTNLTQDHLDFHHDMESYYQAKKRLFTEHLKSSAVAIINCDDPYGERLASELAAERVVTYGKHPQATVRISDIHCDWEGSFFRLHYQGATYKIRTSLQGYFNVANATVLFAYALANGKPLEPLLELFSHVAGVPGRMERVPLQAPFSVVVDYAHTPDALKNILTTAQKLTTHRVIVVFGAGGDRDRSKRAPMAEMVARNCDYAIITSDNPRSESPQAILQEVELGMPLDFTYEVIEDRREAIARALQIAQPGDAVIVAGKGHETYQEIAGVKHHFDDKEIVQLCWREVMGV